MKKPLSPKPLGKNITVQSHAKALNKLRVDVPKSVKLTFEGKKEQAVFKKACSDAHTAAVMQEATTGVRSKFMQSIKDINSDVANTMEKLEAEREQNRSKKSPDTAEAIFSTGLNKLRKETKLTLKEETKRAADEMKEEAIKAVDREYAPIDKLNADRKKLRAETRLRVAAVGLNAAAVGLTAGAAAPALALSVHSMVKDTIKVCADAERTLASVEDIEGRIKKGLDEAEAQMAHAPKRSRGRQFAGAAMHFAFGKAERSNVAELEKNVKALSMKAGKLVESIHKEGKAIARLSDKLDQLRSYEKTLEHKHQTGETGTLRAKAAGKAIDTRIKIGELQRQLGKAIEHHDDLMGRAATTKTALKELKGRFDGFKKEHDLKKMKENISYAESAFDALKLGLSIPVGVEAGAHGARKVASTIGTIGKNYYRHKDTVDNIVQGAQNAATRAAQSAARTSEEAADSVRSKLDWPMQSTKVSPEN